MATPALLSLGPYSVTADNPAAPAGPVLGIETSCDETACAVLSADGAIMAEAVHSQAAHAEYGGVVPEIAARAHLAILPELAARTMAEAGIGWADLAGVAATTGPGLIGGLIVGSNYAKGTAIARKKLFWAINHLEAHALTARLPALGLAAPFPYVLLLISGGHCQLLEVRGVGDYARLGGTLDDAVGEAFDKVGKLLGLGWPGGPALERLAATGDPQAYSFPRPMLGRAGCDFSFSGLKTAVALAVGGLPDGALPRAVAANIAASFQAAAAAVLADRARNALAMTGGKTLVVAGGVASNQAVRAALAAACVERGAILLAPPTRYCTDNAVMVAWAAIERARAGFLPDALDAAPRPRWPLTGASP